jgi:hypothetical protein
MASWATVPSDRSGAANRLATSLPPGRRTLTELEHDRAPGGEGSGMVENQVRAGLAAVEQRELLERHMPDDIERADIKLPLPLLARAVQVVDPVPDVVQCVHQRGPRPSRAPPPNCLSCSMVIRMNGYT